MSTLEELKKEVADIFRFTWQWEDTASVPAPEDLRLNANHAKRLASATVLYADIDGSTDMVQRLSWEIAAEVYRAYLRCAARIIRDEGGVITAYDGDRVMAIFVGDRKNTQATTAALKINGAVVDAIRPAFASQYPHIDFTLQHLVGIDTSEIHAARVGVRGDTDIVWVGRAANYAAKLCNLKNRSLWITDSVYSKILPDAKTSSGVDMWTIEYWDAPPSTFVYGSNYRWTKF